MKGTTSLNIIENNGNLRLLQKETRTSPGQSCVRKRNFTMAGKFKKMASSPGQVLDHQEVRHPAKDHSQRKEDQITDIHELVRHPRRCCFTQHAEEGIVCETHVRLHATSSVWHYKKKNRGCS